MVDLSTAIMKKIMKENKVPDIEQLMQQAEDLGIKLFSCNTAFQLFGYKKEDLIDGIEKPVGASTFLNFVASADKPIVLNF